MPQFTSQEQRRQRHARLLEVLADLAGQGLSQTEIAQRLCVPPSYLSDAKAGSRTLTELFARRFAEEFGVDYRWLLYGEGSKSRPQVRSNGATLVLPILTEPYLGDPAQSPARTGDRTEVGGRATPLAARATSPYVLQVSCDVPSASLRRGDLVLMDQKQGPTTSEIVVLRHSTKGTTELILARRTPRGAFVRLDDGSAIRAQVEQVGQGLGLIWRAM